MSSRSVAIAKALALALALALVIGAACGGPDSPPESLANDWTSLIAIGYTLEPGEERSGTHTVVLERDVVIDALRPVAPFGAHHLVLSVPGVGRTNQLFVAGLGTEAFRFPDGVGLVLAAGTPLILEAHYFNPSDQTVTGEAFIEAHEPAGTAAELVLADQLYPSVTSGELLPGSTTVHGRCTVAAAGELFALLPHMHGLGRRMSVVLHRAAGGGEIVLFDGAFDPVHQTYADLATVAVAVGDTISVDCVYENASDTTVRLGGGVGDEMCVAVIYRYPASPATDAPCTE